MPILNEQILNTIDAISRAKIKAHSARDDRQHHGCLVEINSQVAKLESQLQVVVQEEAQALYRTLQKRKQE